MSYGTLEEIFEEFLDAKTALGLSKKTVDTYWHHFRSVRPYLDVTVPIEDVDARMIRRAVSALSRKGISPNSIRSYTATLKSFFSWCRSEGLCDVDFALFRGVETIPQTYSREELETLLKQPDFRRCGYIEYRTWVIINLLVNNGMRAASVREIQNRDVDLEKGVIVLRHTKTRKTLTMPLSTEMKNILTRFMRYRKGAPDDYLFCEDDGYRMSEDALRKSIARYNRSRGVKKTGIHMFRHTFAKMYIENGGNAFKLQKLLGHSTLAMTKHYVSIFDEDILKDYDLESPLTQFYAKKKRIMK